MKRQKTEHSFNPLEDFGVTVRKRKCHTWAISVSKEKTMAMTDAKRVQIADHIADHMPASESVSIYHVLHLLRNAVHASGISIKCLKDISTEEANTRVILTFKIMAPTLSDAKYWSNDIISSRAEPPAALQDPELVKAIAKAPERCIVSVAPETRASHGLPEVHLSLAAQPLNQDVSPPRAPLDISYGWATRAEQARDPRNCSAYILYIHDDIAKQLMSSYVVILRAEGVSKAIKEGISLRKFLEDHFQDTHICPPRRSLAYPRTVGGYELHVVGPDEANNQSKTVVTYPTLTEVRRAGQAAIKANEDCELEFGRSFTRTNAGYEKYTRAWYEEEWEYAFGLQGFTGVLGVGEFARTLTPCSGAACQHRYHICSAGEGLLHSQTAQVPCSRMAGAVCRNPHARATILALFPSHYEKHFEKTGNEMVKYDSRRGCRSDAKALLQGTMTTANTLFNTVPATTIDMSAICTIMLGPGSRASKITT